MKVFPSFASLPATAPLGQVALIASTGELVVYNKAGTWTTFYAGQAMGTWWTLFLDDERLIDDVAAVKNGFTAVRVARSVQEAIDLIWKEGSLPVKVSLDHDLGKDQPVAVDFVWHLINGHLDEKWDCSTIKTFYVHSANIVGSKNMLALWEGFTKEFGITCQIAKIQALEQPSS